MLNLDQSVSQVSGILATTEPEEVLNRYGNPDLTMVLVKSPHTKLAAEKCSKLVGRNGLVLTLQNGLGNRELLAKVIGDESRILQAVTSQGSTILDSGMVRHTGNGLTSLAYTPDNYHEVKEIADMLTKAGIQCSMIRNLESMLWGKLIINAGINPITALLRVKNGELLENETCRELLTKTVGEAVTVANARGIQLPYDNPLENVLSVAKATSGNISSMLADVMRGTTTEIDSINGAIVSEGEKLGVPVWTNRTLVDLIHSISIRDSSQTKLVI